MPFGLKTAPSLFQKTMCWVFAPIMEQALVYIDDILLFSPSEEAHVLLLCRFLEIVQDYGIMLSKKNMVIGQREINFLGMQLANSQYQPESHVAQELIKHPEESLTKKQIQQFLSTKIAIQPIGSESYDPPRIVESYDSMIRIVILRTMLSTVNYLKNFLPKIAKLTRPLEKMLKKDAPAWGSTQTKAIKELKAQLQPLPPLQIPSTGKRIHQTDASDKYWRAVLLEDLNDKRHI
ncbi:hypothetical protein CRG98_047893 [Punica granatum]|uniref:Reverse transcriptase domain-containing protein n=1 Tax=Punica granatum TaxID=22663 RepID=A0A2I0HJ92_PUNGR|nr:hypothetical protein CRG98_047893 [Punica granatum]